MPQSPSTSTRVDVLRIPGVRRGVWLSVAAGTAVTGVTILQAVVLARAVDAGFLHSTDGASPRLLLVALLWLAAARGWAVYGGEVAGAHASRLARADVRRHLVWAVIRRRARGADPPDAGEAAALLGPGVEALDAYVAQYLPQRVLAGLGPLLVIATVAALDPLSAVILAVTAPLVPLFMYLLGAAAREQTARQWRELARLSARFVDALRGLALLKVLGRVDDEAAAIAARTERFRTLTMTVLRTAFLSALTLELLATLATAVVAVEVGLRLLYGHLTFVPALTVLVLAPECYRPLRALGSSFHAGLAGGETLAAVARTLHGAPPTPVPSPGAPATLPPWPSRPAAMPLRLDGVCLAPAPGAPDVVRDVSLLLPAGALVVVLGPNGAGKSTLLLGLAGLATPSRGSIQAGEPLRPVAAGPWARGVAWVPQHPHAFDRSIRGTLTPDPPRSDDEVHARLRAVGLEAALHRWPRGVHTRPGMAGARLSGGELQRLALGRALAEPAWLVLLDEPTSQLDAPSEAVVIETLRRARGERTIVCVTHRLTLAAAADLLVVLEAGRVVELGTPADLAAGRGWYARALRAWEGGA